MHLLCICFCVCGWQKPKDPQFEPHVTNYPITQGGIQGLGSPLFICGLDTFQVMSY